MSKHLLIIDDDPAVRRSLGRALEGGDLRISSAANAAEGIAMFQRIDPDVVILDLFLPDLHGIEVLKKLRSFDPDAAVIVVTASDEVRDAVEAIKQGALEYLVKPYDLEALRVLIKHALDQRRTRIELGVHRKAGKDRFTFDAMKSVSKEFASVMAFSVRLAGNPSVTILIEGETGVGKEFLARAVHNASPRSSGAFVAISCAALPETLLESELFGHEAGAFTDARNRKKGLFELAEGGTLFLDEVGEMTLGVQVKLLRAIETLTFRRVGGTEDLTIDTRLIAATNVDLEKAVREKKFREDLFYRLRVGAIRMPPLRERRGDIVRLSGDLLREICLELGRKPPALSEEVKKAFLSYAWPGNIRELRNVLERAVILQDADGEIELRHLPREFGSGAPFLAGGAAVVRDGLGSLEEVEREHVLNVLKGCGGKVTRAAKVLGISRTTLWEKLRQYRLSEEGK